MTAALASIPLLVVLIGMAVLRRSAVVAGGVGLLAAAGLALTRFDIGALSGRPPAIAATGTLAEAAHTTATILWIILPALALYEFQSRTGAIERIRDWLGGLTGDRRLQVVLIAWFFGLFVEGAAGFGTPVALAAPLLVGLGYDPVRAVTLALLGHAAGVSFGAVGTPTLAQLELGAMSPTALAGTIAALHATLGLGLLLVAVRMAGDGPLSRREVGWTALAAVSFFVPSVALALLVGPELPSLGGALLGLTAFVPALRRANRGGPLRVKALLPDLAPYLVVVGLVLLTRLVDPLSDGLQSVALDWTFAGAFSGSFAPLYHPGTILFAGLFGGAVLTGRWNFVAASLTAALRRLVPVALALFVMLLLSRVIVEAGMIAALAEAAATTGRFWPLIAPLIGVLGTFITGSATASNILFTELHLSTAGALAMPAIPLVAAQGFGSAIGNVVAPHNIIAGSATVGLVGREGDILARTMAPGFLYAIAGGICVAVVVALG